MPGTRLLEFTHRFSTWQTYLPALYLGIAWLGNYASGLLIVGAPHNSLEARDAGAALVIPLLTFCCWSGIQICLRGGVSNLAEVMSHRATWSATRTTTWLHKLATQRLHQQRPLQVTLALCIAFLFLYSEGILHAQTGNPYRPLLFIQTAILWFFVLRFMFTLAALSRMTNRHLTSHLRVRLFEVEKLEPLCNSITINFMIASGLIAVYTLNSVFVPMRAAEMYLLLVFSLLVLGLFLHPLMVIRRKLIERKSATLERINTSLNEQVSSPQSAESQRRMVDDEQRLQYVSDLLTVRKEIDSAPLWPVNLPFTFKLLMLISLPVLSWVGAGIMSQLLKGIT